LVARRGGGGRARKERKGEVVWRGARWEGAGNGGGEGGGKGEFMGECAERREKRGHLNGGGILAGNGNGVIAEVVGNNAVGGGGVGRAGVEWVMNMVRRKERE